MTDYDYDLCVIGAGSGGIRAARTAAALGAKVAIVENQYLGGTCVNVGCVPKKLLVYASHFHDDFQAAKGFGWNITQTQFDWSVLMKQKNQEINRLQGIYSELLNNSGVTLIEGQASLVDAHTIQIADRQLSSQRILVVTGGQPFIPDIAGKEYISTSNDIFALEKLPRRMVIVGGGYIALEFAGIMNGLGVKTTLCYRGEKLLRGFDDEIRDFVAEEMHKKGIDIRYNTDISSIEKSNNGFVAHIENKQTLEADLFLYATGRKPNTEGLGLDSIGVALKNNGAIKVNGHYQTNIPSIYALGDVTDRVNLTPVATAEAMALVNELYGDRLTPVDYQYIPTAVFSQPNIGVVGLSETEAKKRYSDIDIYKSVFTPMKHTLSGLTEKTLMKMVVRRSNDQVLGVHMVGSEAGEVIQGMAIALRAGASKAVFDSTIGIHPTAAEEFVTLRKPQAVLEP